MKKISIVLIIIISLIIIFGLFIGFSAISFYGNNFFQKCMDLSEGMTKDEVSDRMKDFMKNANYSVVENGSGEYGWLRRLSYDNSLLIALEKDPWYKLDQHPWKCEILFKDGFVIRVYSFFD